MNLGTHTVQVHAYTMEPLNKGHVGGKCCVLCSEVVLSSEVQNVLELNFLGP